VQLYRYFVSFAAITLCVAFQRVFVVVVIIIIIIIIIIAVVVLFRYRLSPEAFGYNLVYLCVSEILE
jgi:hypothetical protein